MIRLPNSFANNGPSKRAIAFQPAQSPLIGRAHVASAARAVALVPSWVFLGMIVLAGVAICSTVNLRASSERGASESQLNRLSSEIENLRTTNAVLQAEIQGMNSNAAIIESTARARLGMVRPTDIVVPIAPGSRANLATLSFVR